LSQRGVPFLSLTIKPGELDALVAEGRYGDAAKLAEKAEDYARAGGLYERIWEFEAAARCFRAEGDLERSLANAIDSKSSQLVQELAEALRERGKDGQRAAMEVFGRKRIFANAGAFAEELDDKDAAIEFYQKGHLDLDAARLLEEVGRDREAGRLLERVVEADDDSPGVVEARLRLGILLARRLQHEEAVRYLQLASKHDDTKIPARRALIVELVALGLRDAARDVLAGARADDPDLADDVEEVIRLHRAELQPRTNEDDTEVVAGRYRIKKLLGAGAAGRVFRARDEVGGRTVAIKMFSAAQARGHQAYERFVREARVTGSLRHQNLVEVFDFSEELAFLVMEYMVGGSLADRLKDGMSQRAVMRMALDLLAGLEIAHQRGIIHRDVKPHNIFFDARGTAKLGDFGVAHLLDLGQTQTGGLIGTLAYMPPEQITGARLTITADLYSVGITLFEALTGRLPFMGPDFVAQHLGEKPPVVSTVADGLSADWDPILTRLLLKDPTSRYEAVDELRQAIEAVDLGEEAMPKPLVLPRAVPITEAAAKPKRALSESGGDVFDEVDDEDVERYQFETSIGRTDVSVLSRAVDTSLDRSVIIERYTAGGLDEASERRLYSLARGGGPFLQRALSYDDDQGIVVYEAPAGTPIGEAFDEPPAPRMVMRLLKRLARAVAPLHELGRFHGSLDTRTVVVDEAGNPTILACGLGEVPAGADTTTDVAAILALVQSILELEGAPNTIADRLVDTMAAAASNPERAMIRSMAEPTTGEELYSFADALEIALLKAQQRG